MSGNSAFRVRRLLEEELPVIMAWMVEEDWHVSINILRSCFKLDPTGWIAAVTSREGGSEEVIGKIFQIININFFCVHDLHCLLLSIYRKHHGLHPRLRHGVRRFLHCETRLAQTRRWAGVVARETRVSWRPQHRY